MYQIIYFYRVILLNKTKQGEFHTYLKTTIINSSPSSLSLLSPSPSSININIIIVHVNKQPSSLLLSLFFLYLYCRFIFSSSLLLLSFFLSFFSTLMNSLFLSQRNTPTRGRQKLQYCAVAIVPGNLTGLSPFIPFPHWLRIWVNYVSL